MEIIIIMIVVSVVANIIKSAGQGQQQTKGAGSGRRPGFPRQGNIPGRGFPMPGSQPPGFDTYPVGQSDFSIEEPRRQQTTIQTHGYDLEREASSDIFTTGTIPTTKFSQPAAPMGVRKPLQVVDTNQAPKYKLDLSRDSMINGIILSEVLGQPKSRR